MRFQDEYSDDGTRSVMDSFQHRWGIKIKNEPHAARLIFVFISNLGRRKNGKMRLDSYREGPSFVVVVVFVHFLFYTVQ